MLTPLSVLQLLPNIQQSWVQVLPRGEETEATVDISHEKIMMLD